MAYEVLARKWRPQQFQDVVGQGHVTQTLQNAIAAKRIAHAYLFVGPRGIGKTSLARIFAKALNCEKGPTATPCDQCDACREIMAGSSMDVLEIDGASNTGVDQVRELRENVKFAPSRGPYKIYIIDEVHMLSAAAFNALLKTLEEPPSHVKFIFATTEAQKILPTIVSRCQRFDLKRISAPLIVERLALIAKTEKVALDNEAALAIARGAEGGLRDAESALDQLIAFCGKAISEDDVLSVFGLVSRQSLESLAEAVLRGDVPAVIRIVGELDACGKDMQRLVIELLDHFRNLLVYRCSPQSAEALEIVSSQAETLKAQSALATVDRLLRIAEVLSQSEDRLRYALSKRTLVETSLIRCARTTSVAVEDLLKRVETLRHALAGGAPVSPAPATERTVRVAEPAPAAYKSSAPPPPPASPGPVANELDALAAQWHEIIERIGKLASLARGWIIDSRPLEVRQDRVIIGFDPEFAQDIERLKNPQFTKAVQGVLTQVLKRQVQVEFRLLDVDGKADVPADHTAEQANDKAGKAPGTRKPKTKQEWLGDPAVRKTLETFNGSIVDIRE